MIKFGNHEIKVIQGRNRSHISLLKRYFKKCLTNFNQTWQENAHCVAATGMQKVKVQGHMRPKVDLEAGVVSNWSVHWTGLCC